MSPQSPLRPASLTLALAAILAAPAALAGPAPAPEATDLDAIVVTASGFEQKIVHAPASISVITPEDLARRPYITLLDAVRDLEGVDVGETRDKTGQGTVSMRGMGPDYTLILINGRRQNNHGDIYPNNFGGNQFNHIPPLDAIERIEVIRGPMSTLYGADAMGGVINIITRKSLDAWAGSLTLGRSFETDDAYGDDSTADFNLTGPLVRGKLDLAVRGSRYRRQASNPVYGDVTDPAGEAHSRALGFGGGGKTVGVVSMRLLKRCDACSEPCVVRCGALGHLRDGEAGFVPANSTLMVCRLGRELCRSSGGHGHSRSAAASCPETSNPHPRPG